MALPKIIYQWSSNSTSRYMGPRSEIQRLKHIYRAVFIAALFTIAKKVETTQMSSTEEGINRRRNLLYVYGYTYSRILFSLKKRT